MGAEVINQNECFQCETKEIMSYYFIFPHKNVGEPLVIHRNPSVSHIKMQFYVILSLEIGRE